MSFVCPNCKRTLDVRRPRRKICSWCSSTLPVNLLIDESGLVTLAQEEAGAAARQRAGRPLTSRQSLIVWLRSLDPGSAEFYSAAADYLRKRVRPNGTYGLFFIFFGIVSITLLVIQWREPSLLTLILASGYLFFGAIGLPLLYGTSATLRNLSDKYEPEDANSRLRRLRKVALNNHSDPIAALVLELIDGTNK